MIVDGVVSTHAVRTKALVISGVGMWAEITQHSGEGAEGKFYQAYFYDSM